MNRYPVRFFGLVALVVALTLAGCGGLQHLRAPPRCGRNFDGKSASERRAWFRSHPVWHFDGRAALSVNHHGGSIQLSWDERLDGRQIDVLAPLAHQHWRLTTSTHGTSARLDGLEGGLREGPDASQLLREATGFVLPVDRIADWVRGIDVPKEHASGRMHQQPGLSHTEYGDWSVDYLEWQCAMDHSPSLPRRLRAYNTSAQLRLVIDKWDFPLP